jgi:hypothetical protein
LSVTQYQCYNLLKERYLSRRLKRRILELCALNNIGRDDKIRKAREILSDHERKQAICNENVGISHRAIDKVLRELVESKVVDEEADESRDPHEEEIASTPVRVHKPLKLVPLFDQDEVNRLLRASQKPLDDLDRPASVNPKYTTYTEEEVREALRNSGLLPSDPKSS